MILLSRSAWEKCLVHYKYMSNTTDVQVINEKGGQNFGCE